MQLVLNNEYVLYVTFLNSRSNRFCTFDQKLCNLAA